MPKGKRYTISFLPQDSDLTQYVDEIRRKQSFSSYIRSLIRDDMNGQESNDLDEVYNFIIGKLKEDGYSVEGTVAKKTENHIDEEAKELILDLF